MALIMAVALWFYAISKHTGDLQEDFQLTKIHNHKTSIPDNDRYGRVSKGFHRGYFFYQFFLFPSVDG